MVEDEIRVQTTYKNREMDVQCAHNKHRSSTRNEKRKVRARQKCESRENHHTFAWREPGRFFGYFYEPTVYLQATFDRFIYYFNSDSNSRHHYIALDVLKAKTIIIFSFKDE